MAIEFRDLKKQYEYLKKDMDAAISQCLLDGRFIGGDPVKKLEETLAGYVGVKHCISCANGTDALQLALMAWNIGPGDAVFVPDFTFFSSGEVVATIGAAPVFVDVREDTFNIDTESLEDQIKRVFEEGKHKARAVIAVDLFGQPAEYDRINLICEKYDLLLLEDGAQGFGGRIGDKKACSFGNISTTSFFPAKPLGCYGDGGAIFTDNDDWAKLIRSYCVHGKGSNKYDNVRIGMNSRLDTVQAAVLNVKFPIFAEEELDRAQEIAGLYSENLKGIVITPTVLEEYYSSWAQYTVRLKSKEERDSLQEFLKEKGIPTNIYYQKPMHRQKAFNKNHYSEDDFSVCNYLVERVLSIPFHPYMEDNVVNEVSGMICKYGK